MAKKEERFEVTFRDGSQLKDEGVRQILQIRRLGLTIFVGNLDMERLLHLFWIQKEKSQLQSKIGSYGGEKCISQTKKTILCE